MKMKILAIVAVILGASFFGFGSTTHAATLSTVSDIENSVDTQDLSHWPQIRDGLLGRRHHDRHYDNHRRYNEDRRHRYSEPPRRHVPPPRHHRW